MNCMEMKLVKGMAVGFLAGWLLAGCSSGYSLAGVEGGRIAITDKYDRNTDPEALNILKPYQQKVDSIMKPVIGHSAKALSAYRPESPLSNWIADVLRQSAVRAIGKPADVAVMNMGGIRNAMPEGEITYGTIYEIAPFENALCVLTMDGATLKELFAEIASVHGEGLSGAALQIDEEGNLLDAKVNGRPVEEKEVYTVATIDYLAEGNDRMMAFRKAQSKTFPKDALLRGLLLDAVKQYEQKGQFVSAQVEGIIKVSASN